MPNLFHNFHIADEFSCLITFSSYHKIQNKLVLYYFSIPIYMLGIHRIPHDQNNMYH
uniref:Uncharacterized protein n=1 Tax=Arundo donax TaxID=35708 RepID=A0A0A9G4Q6_ARUDO